MTQGNERNPWSVFLVFLRLGLTSFGGPVAHLGYFRDEFVTQRKWLSERSYADLVSLCQFLPGPASSQLGMALGLSRAGFGGALSAWAGFTFPSAIILILFALGMANYGDAFSPGALHGLKIVAVAVVAQAVWGMARTLCPDLPRRVLMLLAAGFILLMPSAWAQIIVIVLGGLAGISLLKTTDASDHEALAIPVSRRTGMICLSLFAALLIGLPVLAQWAPSRTMSVIDAFYRAGSLVFGGGHVVLPLLQAEVVPSGWIDNETFLAGYGATQAMPGPLFTFAAFLGASLKLAPNGWVGGLVCLFAIFAPSFLLVVGALPFWERLRKNANARAALSGVNAAVVGMLLAALYDPIATSAIHRPQDFILATIVFSALTFWKLPPWLAVIGCVLTAWSLSMF